MTNTISDLIGKTLIFVQNKDSEELIFVLDDGRSYSLYHSQDCCENVSIEDIIGDLNDLVGSPLTMAEETVSENLTVDEIKEKNAESFTWTFYRFATVKGYVTVRWYGESNGYYSESVDFKANPRVLRE